MIADASRGDAGSGGRERGSGAGPGAGAGAGPGAGPGPGAGRARLVGIAPGNPSCTEPQEAGRRDNVLPWLAQTVHANDTVHVHHVFGGDLDQLVHVVAVATHHAAIGRGLHAVGAGEAGLVVGDDKTPVGTDGHVGKQRFGVGAAPVAIPAQGEPKKRAPQQVARDNRCGSEGGGSFERAVCGNSGAGRRRPRSEPRPRRWVHQARWLFPQRLGPRSECPCRHRRCRRRPRLVWERRRPPGSCPRGRRLCRREGLKSATRSSCTLRRQLGS